MAARTQLGLFAGLAALVAAARARADVQVEWRPRVTLSSGYDDNVLMNGTAADGFGQVTPGLKLDLFGEHDLHLGLDCQAGLAELTHAEQFGTDRRSFASSENCGLNSKVRLTGDDKLTVRGDVNYSQDPWAIAGAGLLLRPGQTQLFDLNLAAEVDHALSHHTQIETELDANALAFGAGDPGNGYEIAPSVRYAWKTSARSKWDVGFREQLFFGIGAAPNPLAPKGVQGGLLDEAHAAQLGYRYELAPWASLTARGGALLLTGAVQDIVMPTARFSIEGYTPWTAISFTLSHDLIIGPTSAGPLVGDVAEVGLSKQWEHFGVYGRGGFYRDADAFHSMSVIGAMGYDAEVGVDWAFTRELKIGVGAVRDAQLNNTAVAAQVNRDVIQVHLTWQKFH